MNRALGWLRKFLSKLLSDIMLQVRIKAKKIDGCDNIYQCKASVEKRLYESSPVFFLSAGRTGSKFVASLLSVQPDCRSYHEPSPILMDISDEIFKSNLSASHQSLLFKAARYEKLLEHELAGYRYFESNQTLVFLIDGILQAFPRAKLVLVTRNPISFANSASRKGWFENDTIWENNRLSSLDRENESSIALIYDYWLQVNRQLLRKATEYPENCKIVKLESMVSDLTVLKSVMSFCGVCLDDMYLKNKMAMKVNENEVSSWDHSGMKKKTRSSEANDWLKSVDSCLKSDVCSLAKELGYDIEI